MTTTGTAGTPQRRLDRDLIVREAVAFIDAHGPAALSMRKLGERLGVEAMSMYRYVTGREDLLEAVVAHLLRGAERDLDDELLGSWQGYLQAIAHRLRAVCTTHPLAFPLVATRHPAAPWLRPPMRSLTLVEHLLSTLSRHGFDDRRAVETYRAFSSFLLGHLLLESVVLGAETGPVEVPLDEGGAQLGGGDQELDLSAYPTVHRGRALLSLDDSQREFETGLEALLDRVELSLEQ